MAIDIASAIKLFSGMGMDKSVIREIGAELAKGMKDGGNSSFYSSGAPSGGEAAVAGGRAPAQSEAKQTAERIKAEQLADILISNFWYNKDSCFAYTSAEHKNLLARMRSSYDSSQPSGNAIAAMGLLKLSVLTGKKEYRQKAEKIFQRFLDDIEKNPTAFCFMLNGIDFYLKGPVEIAIICSSNSDKKILSVINDNFIPNKVIALLDSEDASAEKIYNILPLLKNKKQINNKSTVYVCKNYNCFAPVTSAKELQALINKKDNEKENRENP